MYLPDLAELDAAAATVYAAMPPTPQYSWPLLNAALGTEAWLKHENHTPLGAFKARGGLVYLQRLAAREPGVRTVVAATRGNHGQSVAFAARRHGLEARIFVPFGNSVEKNAAMRSLGARLTEVGHDFQACRQHAQQVAASEGWHMVPSWHPDLVAGVASGYLELLRAQPDLDLLLVPIGQGSGICAAIAARQALRSRVKIVGVVSHHAPAYQRAFRAGHSVEAPVSTVLADGLACRQPDPASLPAILAYADDVLAVTDDEVARAMRLIYRATHNLAEGAGAAAVAAAMQLSEAGTLGQRRLGLPLTGGNVDASVFGQILLGP
ncbi:threonine dehydratase [Massilia sp. PAMC28688]|uniref:threonine dehydratase n=1 Tax=Massilia sp. PAMC28688 TaxID=2861283 RepID=UPI001C62F540|nr:threonine dehydratase [Massilia sp. PAMC28688]QYF92471.1 threonine dehydratase [Massilia sp. PAMC28688]